MRLFIALITLFLVAQLNAQESEFTPPKMVKKAISTSGCYAYFPEDSDNTYEVSYSPDSAKVYTGDFPSGEYHFGIILVKFNAIELNSVEDKEDLLISYLDYLKSSFSIVESAGYGKGHTHTENSEAIGIIDFWEDNEGDQWSVKGWIDSETLAVLFIYGPEDYPNYSIQQFYFNGFRFK